MFTKTALLLILLTLSSPVLSNAESNLFFRAQSPQESQGTLPQGIPLSIDIAVKNQSGVSLEGGGVTLHFYSPDNSIRTITHRNVGGGYIFGSIELINGWSDYFSFTFFNFGAADCGFDGILPDTINITALTLYQGMGLPPSSEFISYIRFNLQVDSTAGGQAGIICIDSAAAAEGQAPDWNWLFPSPFEPVFEGPFCWNLDFNCIDSDGDGFGDPGLSGNECFTDNCPEIFNPGQEDGDGDGQGDLCDNCTDSDGDGLGNPGYPFNTCLPDNCPDIANPGQNDSDGDGLGDICDNCPLLYNSDQSDFDGDGAGDLCDECTDYDGDGFGNPGFPANVCPDDNCPMVYNPDQADIDADGIGDSCDECTDTDGDGFGDPGYPSNTCPVDNCVYAYNPDQANTDSDSYGDICDECTDTDGDGFGDPEFEPNTCPDDNCPHKWNANQLDKDYDGVGNVCDNCLDIANSGQEDFDGDGIGDVCDPCTDSDGDGYGNPGYPENTCPTDNCPQIYNPDQLNSDLDEFGDVCDDDDENDGIPDEEDNCPLTYNPGQEDTDGDGLGDACEWSARSIMVPDSIWVIFANAVEPMVTRVILGNIVLYDGTSRIDTTSFVLNGTIPMISCLRQNNYPGFFGYVYVVDFSMRDFILGYGLIWGGRPLNYGLSLTFDNGNPASQTGQIIMIGHISGDVNDDKNVDILDIIYLINHRYKGGPAPVIPGSDDVNRDGVSNVLDIIYLIDYIFKGGPAPQ